ncbi:MAG: winged helix-turn-helix transcriptional regulator [Bdellovibrionales bacterium]|nr:winged helix-turn-helix transcriptional regulator [Bdellovibrionales bacterium]
MVTKKKKLTSLKGLVAAAECLKTLAHPHRLRMVQLLLNEEHTVGELAKACGIPSHMASEHLGKMKDRGLLHADRRGRAIYYKISEKGLEGIMNCIENRFG